MVEVVDILWSGGEVLAGCGGAATETEEVRRYLVALVLVMKRGEVLGEGKVVIIIIVGSVEMAAEGGKPCCAFLC